MTELYIKNMVCDRCRMAVEQTLREAGLHPESVELGIARVAESTDIVTREMRENILRPRLEALGFELLDDHRQQLIELIRTKPRLRQRCQLICRSSFIKIIPPSQSCSQK